MDYYKDQLYIQGLALMLRTQDDPEDGVVTLGSEEAQAEAQEPIKGRPLSWLTSKMQSSNGDAAQNLPPPYGATGQTGRAAPARKETWQFSPVRFMISSLGPCEFISGPSASLCYFRGGRRSTRRRSPWIS